MQSFDWFEPNALYDVESVFYDITKDSLFIDDKRKDRISFAFRERVDMLLEFVNVLSKKGISVDLIFRTMWKKILNSVVK